MLQHADEIVQAVRDGSCGTSFWWAAATVPGPAAATYTEFARLTPPDTILLTLACGKFRLNDLPLGTVPGTGLPRILDASAMTPTAPSASHWRWPTPLAAASTTCPLAGAVLV